MTADYSPTPSIPVPVAGGDWTTDPITQLSNSSERFKHLASEIAHLIDIQTAHLLSAQKVDGIAQLILAQLAHIHHLAPPNEYVIHEEPSSRLDEFHAANAAFVKRERVMADLLRENGIVVLVENGVPTSLQFLKRSPSSNAEEELEAHRSELDAVAKALKGDPIRLGDITPLVSAVQDALASGDQAKAELRTIDATLARRTALDDAPTRPAKILHAIERAAEADRFEKRWREVLDDEQALSRSYVRLREIVGAMDVPTSWTEESAKQEGIPIEPGESALMWAWTEHQAMTLRREEDRSRALWQAVNRLLMARPKRVDDIIGVSCAICGHLEHGHHEYVARSSWEMHYFEPQGSYTP